ncbi:hypothetical protein F4677DRAFT_442274 [Hypoxylon crocopeplum]|nr:hypothetical protein F4677DRAFT_442274 [Hypoxylon crocopeplum]
MANEGMRDVYDGMEGYIPSTHWAKPYFSNHHHENPAVHPPMLGHVNCSYLSTPGRPPTLEALKQHAQSLTYLISTIVPSHGSAEVDNENFEDQSYLSNFDKNDAYDWLNNLQRPYDNIDEAHRKPLNSLANLVKRNSDTGGVEFHCPLSELPIKLIENHNDNQFHPFQTHMTLLMHANECLERLDHEYSAMGGLLSIIPSDRDNLPEHDELDKAKKTLVGQWILYTQHLTGRMHELEIAYANTLDLLANEAIVPAQHMSLYGPDGRSGREIVFPQDRWILANAGEDVFNFIHQMLDKKEAWSNQQDAVWLQQEAVGEVLRGDKDQLRGIAHVDLQTRFYRLKGSGHGPIFVLPAFSDRPSTEYTKQMENRPTVVTLPIPSAPDRTSAWDRRRKELEQQTTDQFNQLSNLARDAQNLRAANQAQDDELKRLRHLNKLFEENLDKDTSELTETVAAAERERDNAKKQFEEAAAERNQLKRELSVFKQTTQAQQTTVPPNITRTGDGYTMNQAAYQKYQNRSAVVDQAKPQIKRTRAVLESLAAQGQLNIAEFQWIDGIDNCA